MVQKSLSKKKYFEINNSHVYEVYKLNYLLSKFQGN